MSKLIRFVALFLLLVPFPASAAVTCADLLKALGSSLADVNCFASDGSHHQQPANDTGRQFAARAATVCLHAYHRSQS